MPTQLEHNLPHHFTVILLRTGPGWPVKQESNAIFITAKMHETTALSPRIYSAKKQNSNDINKSRPVVKAWLASQLLSKTCVVDLWQPLCRRANGPGGAFPRSSSCRTVASRERGSGEPGQDRGAANTLPCCPVCAAHIV